METRVSLKYSVSYCSFAEVFSFFFYLSFLSRTFTNHSTAGEGRGATSLTPHCHFHRPHRHLGTSRRITAESSPLHIVVAGLELETLGFRAQVANHQALLPLNLKRCNYKQRFWYKGKVRIYWKDNLRLQRV